MTKLFGPLDVCSLSVGAIAYPVLDGFVDVDPAHIDALASYGFVPFTEPVSVTDVFDAMKQGELFAYLKAAGVAVQTPINNAQLRAICRTTAADLAAKEIDNATAGANAQAETDRIAAEAAAQKIIDDQVAADAKVKADADAADAAAKAKADADAAVVEAAAKADADAAAAAAAADAAKAAGGTTSAPAGDAAK